MSEHWLVLFQTNLATPQPQGLKVQSGLRFKEGLSEEVIQVFTDAVKALTDTVHEVTNPEEQAGEKNLPHSNAL